MSKCPFCRFESPLPMRYCGRCGRPIFRYTSSVVLLDELEKRREAAGEQARPSGHAPTTLVVEPTQPGPEFPPPPIVTEPVDQNQPETLLEERFAGPPSEVRETIAFDQPTAPALVEVDQLPMTRRPEPPTESPAGKADSLEPPPAESESLAAAGENFLAAPVVGGQSDTEWQRVIREVAHEEDAKRSLAHTATSAEPTAPPTPEPATEMVIEPVAVQPTAVLSTPEPESRPEPAPPAAPEPLPTVAPGAVVAAEPPAAAAVAARAPMPRKPKLPASAIRGVLSNRIESARWDALSEDEARARLFARRPSAQLVRNVLAPLPGSVVAPPTTVDEPAELRQWAEAAEPLVTAGPTGGAGERAGMRAGQLRRSTVSRQTIQRLSTIQVARNPGAEDGPERTGLKLAAVGLLVVLALALLGGYRIWSTRQDGRALIAAEMTRVLTTLQTDGGDQGLAARLDLWLRARLFRDRVVRQLGWLELHPERLTAGWRVASPEELAAHAARMGRVPGERSADNMLWWLAVRYRPRLFSATLPVTMEFTSAVVFGDPDHVLPEPARAYDLLASSPVPLIEP